MFGGGCQPAQASRYFDATKDYEGHPVRATRVAATGRCPTLLQHMITHIDTTAAGASATDPEPLFPHRARATSWRRFDVLNLQSAESMVATARAEEAGYLVLSGQLHVEQGSQQVSAAAPAVLCCAIGAHNLQAGPQGARLVRFTVDAEGAAGGQLRVDALSADSLPWRQAIHGGGGRIGTRHLWRPEDFVSSLTFIDHAVLSEGSSLGCHYHDYLEEAFVVLSGRGWMSFVAAGSDMQTDEIGAGTVTWQAANIGHGLYNPFAEDLEFIRIAVATPGEAYTTVDLDNDMRQCRPTQEAT